jgi:alkyl hydroperoxide reductase subunit AhpC
MDSVHTNRAYAESMGGLKYPLLADWNPHGALTDQLGLRLAEKGCPSRTTVIVDKDNVIRAIDTNPLGEDRDFSQTMAKLDGLK